MHNITVFYVRVSLRYVSIKNCVLYALVLLLWNPTLIIVIITDFKNKYRLVKPL